ncbi:SirB1 family protein [Pendulispora albinea]|uniref:Tetratricopeptide repeat protein n=1 Tax=Pendulispora albinea TaxID=2741071 RepID=A0ABZ2LV79_9BACT
MASFEQFASRPDDEIDLGLGAVLIARDVYPDLDIERTLGAFDELARPLQGLGLEHASPLAQAEHLRSHLHVTCGFNGNERDYYDARNSLISDVLQRRLGIPISLSVIYCEVAKRVGVFARGVSFPGHFLVRIDPPSMRAAAAHTTYGAADVQAAHLADLADLSEDIDLEPVFVDPFFGCRVLGPRDLSALHAKTMGDSPMTPDTLAAATPRAILHRMLVNLRAVYLSRGDMARAMLSIDRILCLTPNATEPLRERGLLSARLGAREQALADLERFLELAPHAEDAPQIRARVAALKKEHTTLN